MNARFSDVPLVAVALSALLAAGCQGAGDEAAADPAAAAHDHAGHQGVAGGIAAAADDPVAHYTCSMHPAVRNSGPGTCPMCSMALAPVFRRELESGEITLDAGRRQQIGVGTARVELRPLAGPVRAVGTVTYDQSRLTDVTLKVGGWIHELYADRIGQRVKAGEPLFTLYSPDLFETQQKYVDALEKLRNARKLGSSLSSGFLLETRRQRLRLWDLGPDEIERLEDRGLPVERVPILAPASGHVIEKNVVAGAAVAPGMRLLRIAGLDRVWVEADVYESELPLLAVGDRAKVTLRYLPGKELHGRITFVYPWLDGATRTGRVRVELPNPGLVLKPEMYAEVTFERDLGERLAVPQSAVLYAGDRDFVFLDLGDGRLRPQAVKVGGHAGDWVEILDGVGEGDLVVTSGNFLVAAEARLALALEHWGSRPAPPPRGGGHDGHAHGAPAPPAAPEHGGHGGHDGHASAAEPPPSAPDAGHHHAHGQGEEPPPPAPGAETGHDAHAHDAHAHDAEPPPPAPDTGAGHDGHAHAAQPAAPAPQEPDGQGDHGEHGGHGGHDGHDAHEGHGDHDGHGGPGGPEGHGEGAGHHEHGPAGDVDDGPGADRSHR